MAEFEIMDSGEGLDAEARRRIFEPYFTTKGESGGTGLGMSIVYRIVAEHGGEAVADGSPGRGTVITLRVPERAASISG
jgi:polar amino acid transport system substrate-binding protein